MPERARRGLSFANVVSVLALFVALSAGAYAALGKNSVGAKQIKKDAVRAAELKAGAVGSVEIAAGAVAGANLADGAVGGPKLADGAVGGPNLADGAVVGAKLADGAVTAAKVENGSLGADDIGEADYFNFAAQVGVVNADTCTKRFVTGLPNDARDHLVLTPSHDDVSSFHLAYYAAWSSAPGEMVLTACNVSNNPVDDAITHFNLLVIDAQ